MFAEYAAAQFVVIYNHHAQIPQVDGGVGRRGLRARIDLKRQIEPKRGAAAGPVAHADRPSHEFHQLLGNRQPQPGSSIPSGIGRVGLTELPEQRTQLLYRNTRAAVGYADPQPRPWPVLRFAIDGGQDRSGAAELDSVSHQISHHLADSPRISDQAARQRGRVLQDQIEVLLGRLGREHFVDFFQYRTEVECQTFDGQLAGFDLGKIEDVVDDAQQSFPRPSYGFGIIPLLGCEIGIQ